MNIQVILVRVVTIMADVPRKKIMADLQHAFVRRPDTDGFHIKSLDLEGSLQVSSLRSKFDFQCFFQPNVLDLLRDSDDSGHHSPSR